MKSESGNYKLIYKPSDQEVSVANFGNSTLLTGDVRYSAVRAASPFALSAVSRARVFNPFSPTNNIVVLHFASEHMRKVSTRISTLYK